MATDFEFKGLDDLIRESERILGQDILDGTVKKILKEISLEIHREVEGKLPKSSDPSKSGRKGSRTGQHSADNVPVSGVKNEDGRFYVTVGWDEADISPYFYTKFNEYGTSTRPPVPVFLETSKSVNDELSKKLEKELTKLLDFMKG